MRFLIIVSFCLVLWYRVRVLMLCRAGDVVAGVCSGFAGEGSLFDLIGLSGLF